MVYDLFYPIFDMLGLGYIILPPQVFITYMENSIDYTRWTQLLNPQCWVNLLIYGGFAFGCIYVLMILPFRYFKKVIKAPDKKGKSNG